MDFFGEQRRALGQSKRLVVLFAIAVALIVVVIGAIAALAWIAFWDAEAMARGPTPGEVMPVAVVAGLITLAVIALASWTRTSTLRHGGGVVAQQLGGTLIPPDTTNPSYRRLRNVVEEMAIASGVPVPEVYVLEQEPGINAFAAGYTPSDAAIGVTRGTLEQLSRAELQGVIAHEFSHILNGDMRLNIRLVGLLFGILVLSILARTVMRGLRAGRSNNRGAAPILLVAVAVAVIGSIGVLFGRLIKAGLSRQREYLADASAVQFTRDNTGVAGALKKIAITAQGSRLTMADGEEFSHMLFGDGIGYSRLFATHPPLMERIRRVDPSFRPEQLEELAVQWQRRRKAEQEAAEAVDRQKARDRFPGGLGSLPGTEALPGGVVGGVLAGAVLAGGAAAGSTGPAAKPGGVGGGPVDAPAGSMARRVGNPGIDHVRYAEILRADLPPALADAAHMHDHAIELVLAVLVDAGGGDRARQLALIGERRGADSLAAVEALLPHFDDLHPVQRGPLLAIAFPALKRRPGTELKAFLELVEALIHLDGEVSIFEYALGRDLAAQLEEAGDPSRARLFGPVHLPEAEAEAATVLAVLAMHGHDDPEEARRAYLKGLYALLPQASIPYAPPQDWVAALDAALPRLDRLEPAAKSLLLEALLTTLHHDGRIGVQEAELLRAVCAALHCPLPPLLPQRAP